MIDIRELRQEFNVNIKEMQERLVDDLLALYNDL